MLKIIIMKTKRNISIVSFLLGSRSCTC